MRTIIFLFCLGCFLSTTPIFAQSEASLLPPNSLLLSSTITVPVFKKPFLYLESANKQNKQHPDLPSLMLNQLPANMPSTYCVAELAFFCRLEVQMEKATKIPIRFRLGNVQYVDYLEGKHEGWRYNH
ncbi:MAG: hypothetical protein AAGJ93_02795 [Bacteroidota bacterium]